MLKNITEHIEKINYIDLGLPSGTLWSDSYNSGTIFSEEFTLLTVQYYDIWKSRLPTLYDFNELCNCCKIQGHHKGKYEFLLVTGSNGNRIRLLSGIWNKAGVNLFDYWIKNHDNYNVSKYCLPRTIPTYSINNYNTITYQETLIKSFAHLIFIKRE